MTTFDGENLTIILATGLDGGTLDVADDLYEPWKQWVLQNNAQYPPAFRTSGGDPLTPGIKAGAYFFLQNDVGWRIRPAEEDASFLVTGNLAPEDSSLAIMVPTIGAYTVLAAGLQPITQNVAELLTLQQEATYEGTIWIDTTNGTAGTAYPIGTPTTPALTLADAVTIANSVGVMSLNVNGSITLDQSFAGWSFTGGTIALNSQSVDGASFDGCTLSGAGTGSITAANSIVGTISGIGGLINDSLLTATVTAGDAIRIVECSSGIAGTGTPIIDCNSVTDIDVSIRAWTGGIELRNVNEAGDNVSIDLLSGHLVLASTCTAGTIVIRGVGHLTDNSAGSTLVTTGLIEGWRNTELHQLAGLESGSDLTVTDSQRAAAGITQTITDNGTTTTVSRT